MRYRTLIHIGCGAQPDLAAYRLLADQVWLVEADADAVAALEPLVQDDGQLHVRHAVVDVSARVVPFYRYSLPWANGLVALDEATQRLYPSLRCLTDDEVKTEAVDALVSACLGQAANASLGSAEESGAGEAHLLILDVGGHNAALLPALEHSGALARFSTVVIIPAHRRDTQIDVPPSLYGPVDTPAGLNLPDNTQVLARHPLLKALKHAQAHLGALTAEHQQLTATRDTLTKEKSALTAERAGLAKEKQALSAEKQTLTTERDTLAHAKAALTAERDKLKQTIAEGQQRQVLLEEELVKANAQIELIKDLLLREPGL